MKIKAADKQSSGEEQRRLSADRRGDAPWRKWGPYLSERQWGTVREDRSVDGDAWAYFTHDQARSRAYHWGEDGLAGFSDDRQQLCFAIALWNGRDPILKERLFGLTNAEGNHGEDVKEYYFYLDSTPTHSYMKYLYKYPQRAFPYDQLVDVNAQRSRNDFEYELIDTGVLAEDRYFDVTVEYAKASPEDVLIRITAANCGPDAAILHVLPTLWFRNTWHAAPDAAKPELREITTAAGTRAIAAVHAELGRRWLYVDADTPLLFTENETNTERLFETPNATPFVKDAIDQFVVHGRQDAVNTARVGTKAAAHCQTVVESGHAAIWSLRLTDRGPEELPDPFGGVDAIFDARLHEANAFYASLLPPSAGDDTARVMRRRWPGVGASSTTTDAVVHDHGVEPFTRLIDRQECRMGHMSRRLISMPTSGNTVYAAWICVP